MLSNSTADLEAAIDLPAITTSERVLRLAESKRTHAKLKIVAEAWELEPIDIYNEWYDKGCSRDFLIRLVELSQLVGVDEGRQILLECKETRIRDTGGSAKVWAITDAKSAVAKAKELSLSHNSDNTPQPRQTVRMARSLHVAGSKSNGGTGARGTRKRLRPTDSEEVCETYASGPYEALAPVTSRSTESAETANTSTQQHSGAAGALIDSLETRAHPRRNGNATITLSATLRQSPLTPSSAISVDQGSCSIPMADNPISWSSPSQHTQVVEQDYTGVSGGDQQAAEENSSGHSDAVHVFIGAESAEEAHQPAPHSGTRPGWTNDERTDMLLRAFNPDPSNWYIVRTQVLNADRAVTASFRESMDAEDLPNMVLIPLRYADGAQWSAVAFDCRQAHGTMFHVGGCDQIAKGAWSTSETLLTQMGFLQGEASMDMHPLPLAHLEEGVSYGVLIIIAALHMLHESPIDRVSPRLWRVLLSGFFLDGRDSPQERLGRLFADVTKLTCSEANEGIGIERSIEDAESLSVAKTTVQSYAEQARLLLEMTESQLRRGEKRKEIVKFHEWLLAKPSDTGEFSDEVTTLETNVVAKLGVLPEISELCERQLRLVQTSCQHAVKECERLVPILEARCSAMVETAVANYKLLGARLASLCP